MDASFWISLGFFIVLLILSGFFSGSETALTAASHARLHSMENDGNARAGLVNKLRERKDRLLGALLLGNNMVNILASALATYVLTKMFGEAWVAYATIGVTMLVLVFSEVLPKTYAMYHADKVALFISPVIYMVVAVFSPVTAAVTRIVNGTLRLFGVDMQATLTGIPVEELRGAIELYHGTEETQEKKAMLRSILDLADVEVEEIMVHRRSVKMIDGDQPAGDIVDEVLRSPYTRLPLYQESQDNIVGIIHTKLLLREMRRCNGDVTKIDMRNTMMDPWFIPDSTTLFDQLQEFRRRKEHFAIMVDEYGSFKGVVTLEDILEEIVGDIDDEHDVAMRGVRPQPDGSYIVDGKVTIRDLNREFEWGLPDEEYSTVAGLILFEAQSIPDVGQTFTFFGFRFKILRKQRNQITVVSVTPPDDDAEEN